MAENKNFPKARSSHSEPLGEVNNEKTLDDRQKKKRRAAVLIALACVVCLIGAFFINTELDLGFSFGSDETVQHVYQGDGVHRISLYEPDWESDIFENRRWLEKNRYITYVEGGMSVMIVDGDYASYGDAVAFLADYIDALIHGDAERLNGFYSELYWQSHEKYERITMQKLYDVKLENILSDDTKYVYKVTYKIMENDGTFRDDVVSDGERAQYYTLTETNGELGIDAVSYSYSEG